jgi:electron transport complex protein RnfE
MTTNTEITRNGLWSNNVALVQLLGLCPLLAVTSTLVNGIGLGLATLITLVLSNTIVSLIRGFVRKEVRLPVFVLIIASVVTIIELGMKALFYDLYLVLGIFIPLIVTNCAIIGRAEGFASRNPVIPSALDGLMMGLGFLSVLALLGAMREIIGFGTLFANAELMFGAGAHDLTIEFNPDYPGFLLAVLPPGAFFGLALLIVAKNWFDLRPARGPAPAATLPEGA